MNTKPLSLDDIRNILIIMTSLFAIGGIIVNTSNDIFIESIKAKYRNNIENKSFIEILIQAIFYMIIAIDIIGIGIYVVIPILGKLYYLFSEGNINKTISDISITKENLNSGINGIEIFIVFFLFFFAGLLGSIFFCFKIKDEYIKKLRGYNSVENMSKIKWYKVIIAIISVISALNIVCFLWLISTMLNEITVREFLCILIMMANSFGNLIILTNLGNVCKVIMEDSFYKFSLSGETIYCKIYLEYRDFYMVHKDGKERYIKKSEIKEITKIINDDKEVKKN